MNMNLLLITHGAVGATMLEAVVHILGQCPLPVENLAVDWDSDPTTTRAEARRLLEHLNHENGGGTLVLTDLCGSTPGRIAGELAEDGRVKVISGVNLPMLVRVFNYYQYGLDVAYDKALEGARTCIMDCGVPHSRP